MWRQHTPRIDPVRQDQPDADVCIPRDHPSNPCLIHSHDLRANRSDFGKSVAGHQMVLKHWLHPLRSRSRRHPSVTPAARDRWLHVASVVDILEDRTLLTSWTQLGLDIDGEAAGDQSGYSVSLSADGTTVAVGAIDNDGNGTSAGHVRVYRFSGGSWNQLGNDIDGENPVDLSGHSVSLSADGNIVAIGATLNDGGGATSGHVRVYQFIAGSWAQVGSDIDGEAASDESGYSIALSADGTILAIGAINNDGGGSNSGHARVYQFSGGTWTQLGGDIDGEAAGDLSGFSVSLSDDGGTVAVGAIRNDGSGSDAGHVRVYQLSGGAWTQVGGDINGEAVADNSGRFVSVSADGSTIAIGATENDGAGGGAGHVRVYQLSGGVWTQTGNDIDGEAGGDLSGWSVSLSANGNTVAIGAIGNHGGGSSAGHVRVYQLIGGAWTQVGNDIDGEAANDNAGWSVSLSADGSRVAVGARRNDGGGLDAGHIRVYEFATNVDPVLDLIGNRTVDELAELTFAATASDADIPPQALTFALDAPALALGMSIDSSSGVFSWTPSEIQGPGTYNATITVEDGSGGSAMETITVTVNEVVTPLVHVDLNWIGLPAGTDPDGAGAATAIGVDAFAGIQDAFMMVDPAGTIFINPGTYNEAVEFSRDVTVVGTSGISADVTIDPPGTANHGITITSAASSVSLSHITVTNANNGIDSSATASLTLTDVNASGNTGDGLSASSADTVRINGGSFNDNTGDGIDLRNVGDVFTTNVIAVRNDPGLLVSGAASFSDSGGTYSDNDDHGIRLVDISGNVSLIGTTADNNDANNDGIGDGLNATVSLNPTAIGGTLDIFDARFRGSAGMSGMQQANGVSIDGVIGAVTIGNLLEPVTATGNDSDGIAIAAGTSADFAFGTYSNNGIDGIKLSSFSGGVTAVSITAENNGEDGIDVSGAGNVSVSDPLEVADISGNGLNGIDIGDVPGTVLVATVTAANNAQQGLNVDIAGDSTIDGGSFDGIRVLSDSVTLGNTLITSTDDVFLETLNEVDITFGLDAGGSRIDIKANQDNAGAEGVTMAPLSTLRTTDDSPSAVRIQVNTFLPGGSGNATLSRISAGPTAGDAGGRVSVVANNGAILDGNGVLDNISAGNAILIGSSGVGTLADRIDTTVQRLEGAGGTGGFFVENSGGLTVGIGLTGVTGIASTTGDINVRADSPLTVAEDVNSTAEIILTADDSVGMSDNLVVEPGVTVRSTGDNVRLNAGDDLMLRAGSTVEAIAETGRVILTGDAGNADPEGSTITIEGIINSGQRARVRGHNDSDTIVVNAMGTGEVRLNGRDGSDDFIITYPTGDTFKSSILVNDSGAAGDTDEVTIRGTAGVDDLYFTTSGVPATTNIVGRTAQSVETIILNGTVEFFEMQSLEGNDTITAQPSMLFPSKFDGGDPCFGHPTPPPVPPGDTFIFDPLGNEIAFDPDTNAIATLGGIPDPFVDTAFMNFETLQFGAELPSTPLHQYDFNHTNTAASVAESPTQAGYIAVPPDTLYPGSGFGWLGDVDTFERDDSFYSGEFERVTRDGAKSDEMRTFRIDVPEAGYHSVSIVVGNPYSDISGMSVVNGDTGNVIVPNIDTTAASSTQLSFILNVTDLTADIKFLPATETPEFWAVNSLTVRPAEILTMGLDTCSTGPLGADGVSVDPFTLYGAPPNSLLTVSTSSGTIVNADEDPEIAGIQVRTSSMGQAVIEILRPSGMGSAVICFDDVHGTATGCSVIEYVLPDTRNFDYNDGRQVQEGVFQTVSPTQAPVATGSFPGGFLGVLGTATYSPAIGFGWLATPNDFDDGLQLEALGDLFRDGASSDVAHTFRVNLPPGEYDALVAIGDLQEHDGLDVDVNGVNVVSGVSTLAGEHLQMPFEFSVSNDGLADFTFSDSAGAAYWAVNGLQVRPRANIEMFSFTPNVGAVPANGLTVATVTANTLLADGQEVTVSTSSGTIITRDVNDIIAGVQVVVSGSAISFDVVATKTPSTPTLTATSLDGIHKSAVTDSSLLDFVLAPGRRFDFNHTYSADGPGPSITAAGFIGVLRTDTDPATGHGWVTSPSSFDAGVPNDEDDSLSNAFNVLTTDLYRDYHSGHALLGARTFRIQVNSSAKYNGTLYLGSQRFDASTRVTVEGIGVVTGTNTDAKQFATVAFAGAMDTGSDGFIDITFEHGGSVSTPLWATAGVDLVEQGQPLPLPAPIVAEERQPGGFVDLIETSEIDLAVDIAIAAWEDNGVTPAELSFLAATPVIVRDFGRNGALGLATPLGQVVIDDDGSGFGWSPILDVPTGDRYDLVTVLAHEFGHILGRPDLEPVADTNELMSPYLLRGVRHDSFQGTDGFFADAVAELLID